MSVWSRISQVLGALRSGAPFSEIFAYFKQKPEKSVAFTIAVIALGAKMAKADGRVTRDEVAAFREIFTIPQADMENAARVFDLARQDVAGFEIYAQRIRDMFEADAPTLRNLMESLFHIALADGVYHPNENDFLHQVARIFGLKEQEFRSIRTRFTPTAEADCYDVLGVSPKDDLETIRAAWRRAVRETHPDRLIAQGLPEEAVKLGEKRLIALNRAWEQISDHHPQSSQDG